MRKRKYEEFIKKYEESLKVYEECMKKQEEEIKQLKKCIKELKGKESEGSVWIPEYGEKYWNVSIGECRVFRAFWRNSDIDKKRLNVGNVYKTQEEARFQLEKLNVLGELKQFSREFKYENSNFCLHYNVQNNEFVYHNITYIKTQGTLYFESEEILKQAIKKVGEDRIKKYLFEVEE